MMAETVEHRCAGCDKPVYANGEGVWFGPDDRPMCSTCGDAKLTVSPKRWDFDKGCWEKEAA
jgi:hypothetical protein